MIVDEELYVQAVNLSEEAIKNASRDIEDDCL